MLKKRNLLFLSLLILGILLLSSCFLNPPVTEGILKGQIMVPEGTIQAKDLTGQALPDATVNIIDLSTGAIIATTVTDSDGYYQVSVPPGGPYLLEAAKDGVKLEQITCSVEVGIEYDLGTADCMTTTAALIAQAMMDAGDNPADIDCAAIIADPNFDDVSSIVCSTIKAGQDPTTSALVQQAVEYFLNPPTPTPSPTPNPTPTPLSDAKTITTFDFLALDPDVIGVIDEGAKTIALTVPNGTVVTALVATFTSSAASAVTVGGAAQTSATTENNFTNPVAYLVTAEDGTTVTYTVTVNAEASHVATVTSGTYTVSAGGTASETIINVSFGTAKATFLAALTKGQADQTWVDTAIADPVVSTNTLVVTAQDGTTVVTYTVTVNAVVLAIGDSYGGGIVAYILQAGEFNGVYGYDENVQHGLIAATADQSTAIHWWNESYMVTSAIGLVIGFGQANTAVIVAKQGVGSYAAQACDDYSVTVDGVTYTDWFLPSKDELNKLYLNKDEIGSFADEGYWSSSESRYDRAWYQDFYSGNPGAQDEFTKDLYNHVRAVRAF